MGLVRNIIIVSLFLSITGCGQQVEQSPQKYFTWDGLEPDKWSSAWLIKRHIDPGSELIVVPVGAVAPGAIGIDTPYAKYKRTHGTSTFENLTASFNKGSDTGVVAIGEIINQLEVSPWSSSSELVAIVEGQYRALQKKYDRVDVPVECYYRFFDRLYVAVSQTDGLDHELLYDELSVDSVCNTPPVQSAERSRIPVPEYPIEHLLKMIDSGKRVVFVDTREDREFDEAHIPGSINIKLREVNDAAAQQLKGADLVISYCVKDFRAYEVALALSRVGVSNIGIMKPYGITGWRERGMPLANSVTLEATALAALKVCAANGKCS